MIDLRPGDIYRPNYDGTRYRLTILAVSDKSVIYNTGREWDIGVTRAAFEMRVKNKYLVRVTDAEMRDMQGQVYTQPPT